MAYDSPQPTLRPGERLLHGAVEVFNSGLLNAHLADRAIEAIAVHASAAEALEAARAAIAQAEAPQ